MKTPLPIDELNILAEELRMSQYNDAVTSQKAFLLSEKEIEDKILGFLTYAYLSGFETASEELGATINLDSDKMTKSVYEKVAGKTWVDRVKDYVKTGDVEAIIKVADTEMVRITNDGGEDVAIAVSEEPTNVSGDTPDTPTDTPTIPTGGGTGGGTSGGGTGGGNPTGPRDSEGSTDGNGGGYSPGGGTSPNGTSANIRKTWNTMGDDRVRDTHAVLDGTSKALNEAFFTIDGDSAMSPGRFILPENNVGCRCWLTYKKV